MLSRLLLLVPLAVCAADPTFLRRDFRAIQPQPDDLTVNAKNAEYRPAFGIGDKDARQVKGIARYGELTVNPGGETAVVSYPAEEQIYYILEGAGSLLYGSKQAPIKAGDFMYLPPGVGHGVANATDRPVRLLVMGYKIPRGVTLEPPADLMIANSADVPLQVLPGHGPTTQFKLLMGTTKSTRDKLAAASQMVSLFIMDFAPGGTNIPHHHESEEEIYYVLRGSGDMVAGGGADGNEGRYLSRQGEVWFIRLNATVGFYSAAKDGQPHDQILAVRSTFPFSRR